MTLVVGDRIQETTTTTGTGTITLLGAVTQFQSFAAGVGNGNSTYYTIADQSGVNWEEGIGTYTTSGSTLTRTVLASSNAGALVNFPAGTKNVFCSYPAEAAVLAAPYAYPTISPSLNLDFANSKQLDPRITFSRLSTATYYDGQTTAMAEQNLLLQSQAFGTTPWIFAGASITTTELAPDGTSTASLMTCVGQYNSVRTTTANISGLVVGTTYTVSLWVKSNVGTNAYTIWLDGSSTSIGTITPTSTWTRYSFSFVYPSGATTFNLLQDRNASGFGSVYIWGAQLEQRSSATAYTPTTTTPITNYIPQLMTAPAGVARFDHDPITGKSLGLLIEESRANLTAYSSSLVNPTYNPSATAILNTTIAPDGTLTADSLIPTTYVSGHGWGYAGYTADGTTTYTFSVYLKLTDIALWKTIKLRVDANSSGEDIFDLSTGIVAVNNSGKALIIPVGNGWYRCITSAIPAFSSSSIRYPYIIYNATTAGDGYSGIYVWGAQLEVGSFATSYIPTTTGSVTRSADQASMTGVNFSSWYNQSQGSFYAEFDVIGYGTSNSNRLLVLCDSNNGLVRHIYETTAGLTGTANVIALATLIGVSNKVVYSFDTITTNMRLNNIATASNLYTSGSPISYLNIGNLNGIAQCNGHIKKLSYYPKALSTTELQALTS